MKTADLTGTALDWAVSVSLRQNPILRHDYMRAKALANNYKGDLAWHLEQQLNAPITVTLEGVTSPVGDYHQNWAWAGPIIQQEDIALLPHGDGNYEAEVYLNLRRFFGPTALIAAMRAFVASKLGDEVEIPDELI